MIIGRNVRIRGTGGNGKDAVEDITILQFC